MKFRLSDICDIKVGFPFKSNGFNENGDGVRLVRGMNISKNGFRWGNQTRWWNNVTHDLDDYFLKENDVLVAMDGNVSTNFVNVSKEDLPLLLVQRVARLRSKIKPSNIIWYIVKSPNFGAYLNSVKTGTTISHISSKQIGDFEVYLPDFEYLENVCTILSTLDDKIKRNNQINDNLSSKNIANKSRHSVTLAVKNLVIKLVCYFQFYSKQFFYRLDSKIHLFSDNLLLMEHKLLL